MAEGEAGGSEMVEAVRAGDQGVFAELAERYRHELRVHCYRMLGSFTEAEDIVQDTLLRAWRKRESFQGRSTFRAWLYRIATNACLDVLSSPARGREVVVAAGADGMRVPMAEVGWLQPYPDALLDLAAPGEGEPDAVVITRETIELAFLAAIQHLPPRQRAVLILRDVLGWPAAETAAALELSVVSVKSALQRARVTMREQLPERRSDWGRGAPPSEEERAVLQRYLEASDRADLAALAELLRADARQTMPPLAAVYDGREAILAMWRPVLVGPEAWGEWRGVRTAANRQPAVANYVRRDGERDFSAVNLDVLRIEGDQVVEITTFGVDLFAAFGLATRV
ncbi:RNA polymerase subunit sigma-70 [Acrocarpospora macrocephala]|uniref:RNA polymerase sigma factor n=2 Tax=Acrocarpospora macrocephala TaxID=150177 RepID=A0A5M3X2C1_9ACTN|nr:RNA polymerase sigma factor [Acrocarpospora macrocephala]